MKFTKTTLAFYIVLQTFQFFLMVYSGFRLYQVNRKGFQKTYQNIFYLCILTGSGIRFATYFVDFFTDTPNDTIYFLVIPASYLILFSYVLMIPVQAKLYYLCCESETGEHINHRKKIRNLYFVITIVSLFPCLFELILIAYKKTFENTTYNDIDLVSTTLCCSVCIILWVYYGIKLTGIVKRVAGAKMWNKMIKLFLVEIVWSIFWILHQIFSINGILKDRTNSKNQTYLPIGTFIYILLEENIPPFLIMIVVFESPKRVRAKELLLDEMETTSSSSENF
ncbi:tobamovirus multiplication protein 1-like isoform x1 [Anaeramoeba flamelloides]|uniref:Tobamovirus multiplication protein 1-like isoform x1 n=1 Tax=Anaeramoeba flamelloides TaxID=1746091 RepID=A0ABQ8YPH3_9EUKA|nr:tobamovirus multiplication protein 1-like isoform x1 [Anaeramoeba flamelloides]